jgi:hypothetical protein
MECTIILAKCIAGEGIERAERLVHQHNLAGFAANARATPTRWR